MSIVVRTLAERVYEDLRNRIVTGQLGTGVPIRQDALAAQLGVSKIPVREALARLEQVGLLVGRTNRGYMVPPRSTADIEDIYSLRLAVEPRAAAFAAARADVTDQLAAQAALEALERAVATEASSWATATQHFHAALVRPGNRPLTLQLVERLLLLSVRYWPTQLPAAQREPPEQRARRAILDAWLARDADAIQLRLAAQIDQNLQRLIGHFSC